LAGKLYLYFLPKIPLDLSLIQSDPNLGDQEGKTPLAWGIVSRCHTDTIVNLLHCFPECDPHKSDQSGSSPLMLACAKYKEEEKSAMYLDIIATLLTAPQTKLDGYEVTLLVSQAITSGDIDLVKIFASAGVNPDNTDDNNIPLIELAEDSGNSEIKQLLLGHARTSRASKAGESNK
jgi:ankyrin repeat protein